MRITVKTLKGNHFDLEVEASATVDSVKKQIEELQGREAFPWDQQLLIHQGKVMVDSSTLDMNRVSEKSFIVVMLSKVAPSSPCKLSLGSPAVLQARMSKAWRLVAASVYFTRARLLLHLVRLQIQLDNHQLPQLLHLLLLLQLLLQLHLRQSLLLGGPAQSPAPPTPIATGAAPAIGTGDVYGRAAGNLVAGTELESTVQQIMDMGGGIWQRDMVIRALRAAFNNPERAVEYLYSGIPEATEAPAPVARPPEGGDAVAPAADPGVAAPAAGAEVNEAPAPQNTAAAIRAPPSGGPNAAPLDLFPQGMPGLGGAGGGAGAGALDFLRNNPQAFPSSEADGTGQPSDFAGVNMYFYIASCGTHFLPLMLRKQPMLQELGKQNPQLLQLINSNQGEFLRLINEPGDGGAGDMLGQMGGGAPMPQAINVTPDEKEAIDRLEAMGFDRELVIEAFFACDKNEQLAANYLLEHGQEYDD
eukprot:SM000300S11721  [mRNA]  locus=s300:85484:89421:- [translate_table: standard]